LNVEPAEKSPRSAEPLRELVAAYRRMLSRYRRIEAMSQRALQKLRSGGDVRDLNSMVAHKWKLYREIREEEERVTGAREWWKRSRQALPAEECRELLSLLDAIGKTLEAAIDHEEECRQWLTSRDEQHALQGRHLLRSLAKQREKGA
jgi:hypothetical protein